MGGSIGPLCRREKGGRVVLGNGGYDKMRFVEVEMGFLVLWRRFSRNGDGSNFMDTVDCWIGKCCSLQGGHYFD